MDAVIKKFSSPAPQLAKPADRPSQAEVEAAVRVLLRWTGDDPDREGLVDTPKRVAKAYREMFSGYAMDPADELGRTFEEVAGYDDLVIVKDIEFHSHCEHHMVPIIGKAHVGYLPDRKVVGLSKIIRVVEIFAHRLQTQAPFRTFSIRAASPSSSKPSICASPCAASASRARRR